MDLRLKFWCRVSRRGKSILIMKRKKTPSDEKQLPFQRISLRQYHYLHAPFNKFIDDNPRGRWNPFNFNTKFLPKSLIVIDDAAKYNSDQSIIPNPRNIRQTNTNSISIECETKTLLKEVVFRGK
ncbi:hypothetical protein CEXT_637521 [Caerostris extrusa]|uniref:Uncharacterized protein n=1 Tax=Caerostris extrusa TaxID=172846 RepID=A0AAV4VU04_CAEEX|nr:hypothetical protein CEXT_637521 [Caerostris extrusa]